MYVVMLVLAISYALVYMIYVRLVTCAIKYGYYVF